MTPKVSLVSCISIFFDSTLAKLASQKAFCSLKITKQGCSSERNWNIKISFKNVLPKLWIQDPSKTHPPSFINRTLLLMEHFLCFQSILNLGCHAFSSMKMPVVGK